MLASFFCRRGLATRRCWCQRSSLFAIAFARRGLKFFQFAAGRLWTTSRRVCLLRRWKARGFALTR